MKAAYRYATHVQRWARAAWGCVQTAKTIRRWRFAARQGRQTGAAMIEMLAAVSVVGAVSAVALNQREALDDMALETHAQVTAAAVHSAARMLQAQWLVTGGDIEGSPLVHTLAGIPMGLDSHPSASQADCQALWQAFITTPQSPRRSRRFWSIDSAGEYCHFSYHHEHLAPVLIKYHTVTGDVRYQR